MPKTITVQPQKRRGPTPTGKGTPIQVRMLPPLLERVDGWIAGEPDQPSRPEAVRRLVEKGLTVKRRGRRSLRPDQLNAGNDG